MLIILSSPSGAGKTTIAKKLLQSDKNLILSISATTRAPREGEEDGKDYFFISKKEFKTKISHDHFLEYAKVYDNFYGTPKEFILSKLKENKNILFDIDWQGAAKIRQSSIAKEYGVKSFFIIPPSLSILRQRLQNRSTDSAEIIEKRMMQTTSEISHLPEYDYAIINKEIDISVEKIKKIIASDSKESIESFALNFVKFVEENFYVPD